MHKRTLIIFKIQIKNYGVNMDSPLFSIFAFTIHCTNVYEKEFGHQITAVIYCNRQQPQEDKTAITHCIRSAGLLLCGSHEHQEFLLWRHDHGEKNKQQGQGQLPNDLHVPIFAGAHEKRALRSFCIVLSTGHES